MKRRYLLLGVVVCTWLAALLYATRFAMLDDALIHLRYATYLNHVHFITFDGVHRSFGTSSLLYVSLLAILRSLTQSPMLPKVCSVVAYLALLGFAWALWRRAAKAQQLTAALALVLVTPMAVRWLTDGMETGLVLLMVGLYAWGVHRYLRTASESVSLVLTLGAVLMVLLRVELAVVIAFSAAAGVLEGWSGNDRVRRTIMAIAPLIGACVAMLLVFFVFGHLLPDTAAAKETGDRLGSLFGIGKAIGSSLLFGIGTLALWIASAWLSFEPLHNRRMFSWVLMNLPFPAIVFLSSWRGQAIHGVRYVVWTLGFSLVLNLLEIADDPAPASTDSSALTIAFRLAALLFVVVVPFDFHYAWRAMAASSQAFQMMRDQHLEQFKGQTLVASDIGFIAYFSEAKVCDLKGLVNGREAAQLSPIGRLRNCAAQNPDFAYLSSSQAEAFNDYFNISEWPVCEKMELKNVGSNDTHYLAVPPARTATLCAPFGGPKLPLKVYFAASR